MPAGKLDQVSRLLGRVEEHMLFEKREHSKIDSRFDIIERKIDNLNNFKWKLIGASAAATVLASSITAFLRG